MRIDFKICIALANVFVFMMLLCVFSLILARENNIMNAKLNLDVANDTKIAWNANLHLSYLSRRAERIILNKDGVVHPYAGNIEYSPSSKHILVAELERDTFRPQTSSASLKAQEMLKAISKVEQSISNLQTILLKGSEDAGNVRSEEKNISLSILNLINIQYQYLDARNWEAETRVARERERQSAGIRVLKYGMATAFLLTASILVVALTRFKRMQGV